MQATLQVGCWLLAFWVAVLGYAAHGGDGRYAARLVAGLALGAALAHVGWALLHLSEVLVQPRAGLSPAVGYTVLPVPLGLLVTAPWRAPRAQREAHLAAAFQALLLALCAARLGCVLAGCCHGTPTALPWGVAIGGGPALHPTALYEMAGLLGLYACLRRTPARFAPGLALAGFGALRVAVEPLRAAPPLGPTTVSPALLGAAWIGIGGALALAARAGAGGRARPSAARNGPLWPESAGHDAAG
jgi:hypothetical protein